MKKTNKLTSLDIIFQEKEILKKECAEYEDVLAEQWAYVNDNIGSLLYMAAGRAARSRMKKLIFPKSMAKNKTNQQEGDSSDSGSGLFSNVLGSFQIALPLIWEIAQPLLVSFAMKKIKSIFSSKKK